MQGCSIEGHEAHEQEKNLLGSPGCNSRWGLLLWSTLPAACGFAGAVVAAAAGWAPLQAERGDSSAAWDEGQPQLRQEHEELASSS
jgi:hypothetical protein